jgi:hypothetical protein
MRHPCQENGSLLRVAVIRSGYARLLTTSL